VTVAFKSRLKLVARAVLSADAGLLVTLPGQVRKSRSWVKVQDHRMTKFIFSAMDARYDVTYVWLFVEFFAIKWSVRPRVKAF